MSADWIIAHQKATEETFLVLRRTPRESIRFITVIVYAVVVRLNDDIADALRNAVAQHDAEHRATVMRNGWIARGQHGRTRWAYCYEIDLLHSKLVCSEMKRELLAQFGIATDALRPDQRILVLHTHGVTDARGHASAEILARDLRRAFPGPRRVHVTTIREEGTVAANLSRIASYSTKFVHRYSRAWGNKRTEYLCNYEHEWRAFVMRCYKAIGTSRLMNANITTQIVPPRCGRRMYDEDVDSSAEIGSFEALQLIISKKQSDNIETPNTKQSYAHKLTIEYSNYDRGTMRAHEIIDDYIDPDKITSQFRRELEDALERQGPPADSALLNTMYGDPVGDCAAALDLEQQRLDLEISRAEIAKAEAEAERDRAEARELHSTG